MKFSYTAILAIVLCSWAMAAPLTVNGVQYDTETLADNCLIVQFSSDNKPAAIAYEQNSLVTGITAFDQLNAQKGVTMVAQLFPKSEKSSMPELSNYFSVTFNQPVNLESAINDYQLLREIDSVEPVPLQPVYYTPNDPSLGSQWGLTKVEAENAWNVNQGSSEVILAIADSGVDWDHPDLADDIWHNADDPIDGSDNDDNGLVDDHIGWDWVTGVPGYPGEDYSTPDNDPMDFDGHGTHCSGIAAACTDNGVGVAGLGFDCKVMCLRIGWRHSDGNTYVRMDFAAQAFVYAADKGAAAINCSWGSSYANYLRDAVDYAVEQGVVVITAAGNDGTSSAPYLGTRTDVISVAATDQSDLKTSFSNYGVWVDVCAPGISINSTYFDDAYSVLQGTSMAAPFVVGLVGLIKSSEPDLERSEIIDRIYTTADPIDNLNPDYNGLLGYGRINAYTALASNSLPNFNMRSSVITITEDDGDNILNPGESFDLSITIQNIWADAIDVTAIARSNEYFTANDSTTEFGDIPSNQVRNNSSDPFNFTVGEDLRPGSWNIDIDMYASDIFIETMTVTVDVFLDQTGFPIDLGGNIESSPLVFDFDSDGDNEIIVGANDGYLYALEADGSNCAGWPQSVSGNIPGGAAIGDIDNDGAYEIAVGSKDGYVYAWEADGTAMSGFPIDIDGTIFGGAMLMDIDGNSNLEIVVASMSNREIYVIRHDGTQFDWSPISGGSGWFSSGIAAEIDFDGIRELIFAGLDSHLHAWNSNGNYPTGFPVDLGNPIYASATSGDLDGDMVYDIAAVTSQGEIYAVASDGSVFPNFPVDLNQTVIIYPIVADINHDFLPEIIVVDNARHIHAIGLNGEEINNFPIECGENIKSSPVVADIDGNGTKDIIVGCTSGLIYAYDYTGSLVSNFPIGGENLGEVRGAPAISDLDGDGDLEIVFATYSSEAANLMVVDYKSQSSLYENDWPCGAYDNQRRGCYISEPPTGIDDANVLPHAYSLAQNYPNPFNATTTFSFTLPEPGEVTIELFDILGRKVETLQSGYLPAGSHFVNWNAAEQSSGIYFYKMTTNNFTETKRCLLIK